MSEGSATEDLHKLLERIDALQDLLACYRVGKRPTEKLFKRLDRTQAYEDEVRSCLGCADA